MSDTLGKAFLLTQDAIRNPHLDSVNPHFGSKFASLAAHIDAIIPTANKFGLNVIQEPVAADGQLALRTRVIHADTGEFYESTVPLQLDKTGPQGAGSAITYFRRYALASIFGVVGEADDDGNTAQSALGGAEKRATDATVTREVTSPAPVAAPSFIEKAQQAQTEKRPNRPDMPVQTGVNKSGKPRFTAVTFVKDVTQKNGGFYEIEVVLDGQPRVLSTKLQNLIDAAVGLRGSSCRVEWTEVEKVSGDKTFVNRYLDHIEPVSDDGVEESVDAYLTDMDSIPF